MPKVVPEYKEEAKAKIVKAARVVFAKKGYHDATMDDVAKEVGVSKGALYSYFASKEDFIKEISLQGHQALRNVLTETAQCCNLQEALEKAYGAVAEQFKGSLHTHFEILALSSHDPKIKLILTEDYRKDTRAVEAFVEEKKRQGIIRTDIDARVLAELFTALYLGSLAKLVMGFPNQEVHDQWIKSMTLILTEAKNLKDAAT
jgi:AcrR family transcriptional regulator